MAGSCVRAAVLDEIAVPVWQQGSGGRVCWGLGGMSAGVWGRACRGLAGFSAGVWETCRLNGERANVYHVWEIVSLCL